MYLKENPSHLAVCVKYQHWIYLVVEGGLRPFSSLCVNAICVSGIFPDSSFN